MRVKILGQYWNLRLVPLKTADGDCSHPAEPPKELRIHSELRGLELMEVVIHEVLHAANWHLDEEFVQTFSEDVSRVLFRKEIWRRIIEAPEP